MFLEGRSPIQEVLQNAYRRLFQKLVANWKRPENLIKVKEDEIHDVLYYIHVYGLQNGTNYFSSCGLWFRIALCHKEMYFHDIVTCIPIDRQRLGKDIPAKITRLTEGRPLLGNGPVNMPL
jgi:hypothetical protein